MRESGVSKGGIYWHFKGKEDILVSIIEEWMDSWIRIVEENLADISLFREWLTGYGMLYAESCDLPLMRIFIEFYWCNEKEEYKLRMDKCFAFDRGLLADKFSESIGKGELQDGLKETELADLLLSYLDGVYSTWQISEDESDLLRKKFTAAMQIFIKGLPWKEKVI